MIRSNRKREEEELKEVETHLPEFNGEDKDAPMVQMVVPNDSEEEIIVAAAPKLEGKHMVTITNLNVRNAIRGKVIRVIGAGAPVYVLEEIDEWARIGENEYVMREFLE